MRFNSDCAACRTSKRLFPGRNKPAGLMTFKRAGTTRTLSPHPKDRGVMEHRLAIGDAVVFGSHGGMTFAEFRRTDEQNAWQA